MASIPVSEDVYKEDKIPAVARLLKVEEKAPWRKPGEASVQERLRS